MYNTVYKYLNEREQSHWKWKTTYQLSCFTHPTPAIFSHSIALLILFSKCCLCPPGGGFSIYGGVLRGCEPITVSQSLCACLSTLWLENATQFDTHTQEQCKQMHREKMWMGRIHWNVWEAHICDTFFSLFSHRKQILWNLELNWDIRQDFCMPVLLFFPCFSHTHKA